MLVSVPVGERAYLILWLDQTTATVKSADIYSEPPELMTRDLSVEADQPLVLFTRDSISFYAAYLACVDYYRATYPLLATKFPLPSRTSGDNDIGTTIVTSTR